MSEQATGDVGDRRAADISWQTVCEMVEDEATTAAALGSVWIWLKIDSVLSASLTRQRLFRFSNFENCQESIKSSGETLTGLSCVCVS